MATARMRAAAPAGSCSKKRHAVSRETPRPDPQHLPTDRIDHDRGVAMPLVQCELVHRQVPDLRPVRLHHRRTQPRLVDRLDRVPAQAVEGRYRLHRARPQQLAARLGQPVRHPLVAPQPAQPLQPRAGATIAPQPPTRHVQHHSILKQRQIPDPAHHCLVHLPTRRAALLAVHHAGRSLEVDRHRLARGLGPLHPIELVTLPATQRLKKLVIAHPAPR